MPLCSLNGFVLSLDQEVTSFVGRVVPPPPCFQQDV
jgi:hypothetical protein